MKKTAYGSEIAKAIGKNLQRARREKGYSQKQLAAMLGKYQSDYSDYETGKVQLDYEKIVFICKTLDVTPNDLFDNTIDRDCDI